MEEEGPDHLGRVVMGYGCRWCGSPLFAGNCYSCREAALDAQEKERGSRPRAEIRRRLEDQQARAAYIRNYKKVAAALKGRKGQ